MSSKTEVKRVLHSKYLLSVSHMEPGTGTDRYQCPCQCPKSRTTCVWSTLSLFLKEMNKPSLLIKEIMKLVFPFAIIHKRFI